MAHVWQYQLGYPVCLRGALRLGLDYRYRLRAGATLADFNMEAQGDLLADYFVLKMIGNAGAMRWRDNAAGLALFEAVLADFLALPAVAPTCRGAGSPSHFDQPLTVRFARRQTLLGCNTYARVCFTQPFSGEAPCYCVYFFP